MRLGRGVAALWLSVLLIGMAAACESVGPSGSSGDPSPGGTTSPAALVGQAAYALAIRQDQRSLDKGLLVHTDLRRLDAGAEADFLVTVTDLGRKPPLSSDRDAPRVRVRAGEVASDQNIPTGGDLGVTASCTGLGCEEISRERQPVVGTGSSAVWSFVVRADRPGTGHIRISAVVYRLNTDEVLDAAIPVEVTVTVHRTWSSTWSQIWHWLLRSAPGLGISSGAVATAGVGLGRRLRRRGRRTDIERVLASIPRTDEPDWLLFRLSHASGVPVERLLGVDYGQVYCGHRTAFVAIGSDTARVTDRAVVRALRRRLAGHPRGAVFALGDDALSFEAAQERWRTCCARVGFHLPITDLHA
ncbi:hypothetical protein ACFO3J_09535 [Streptomyces polygonati]|uniref:Uncharacterized protein n=1 Tax=Streptomyces polygonati TaxID=1617087 RepID=A0ABV8HLK3_9ACTN